MMMYKCKIAYDGKNYAGWQKQINALGIQEIVEKCLTKIFQEPVDAVASGRTDAKVHATGQIFHVQTKRSIPCDRLKQAMNALLPKDIRIQEIYLESSDFHARFSATGKCYEYICTYDQDDPFVFDYKEILYQKLDLKAMKEASQYLIGTHDFTSFSSSKIDPRKPREKTIYSIEIFEKGNDLHFVYQGSGFLRYQVRMMTGTLIAVGQNKISSKEVQIMLEKRDKHACRYNASAQGLYLRQVYYERERS